MGQTETVVFELDPDLIAALEERVASAEAGCAFLLPIRIEGSTGVYRESQFAIPKELRAAGLPVEFLHPSERRRTLGEFSSELGFGFALGVAQNMSWDAAKLIWQYVQAKATSLAKPDRPPMVSVEVARMTLGDRVISGLRITGPADDETAAAVIRALTGDAGEE